MLLEEIERLYIFASEMINDNNKTDIDMKARHLNFDEVATRVANPNNLNDWQFLGDKPAIVDFYASWCGPCKMLAPVLDDVARDYDGKVDVYKIDVDKEPALANAFKVRSIPTLLFITRDKLPVISRGAMSKSELIDTINSHLL